MTNSIRLTLLLLFSGGLITLSLAPFTWWPLAILSLALLNAALHTANHKQSLWLSFAFSAGMYISGVYWVYVSMNSYGGASPILATIMMLGFCLFLSTLIMPFAYCYCQWLRNSLFGSTAGFAAVWVLLEWFRSWFLTGFPWLYIGYSQVEGPLAPWAPVISVYGISLLLAFTAAVISQTILGHIKKPYIITTVIFWALAFGLEHIPWTSEKGAPLSVALIQPNIDLKTKWAPENKQATLDYFQTISATLQHHDLIIWPETAIPQNYHTAIDYLRNIGKQAEDNQTAIILGIPSIWYQGEQRLAHNSMVAIGQAEGIYHKQKLVPFGEYLPLESLLRGLISFFDLPMSHFTSGPKNQQSFKTADFSTMPYICYEIVYPGFVAKTASQVDLLLTVSNDAWFGESIGPIQHLQIAQMRALENGRYLLRGTNNGVTAIIDHKGKITQRLAQFERSILEGKVYRYQGLTPVARYGTLPTIIFAALIVLLLTIMAIVNPHD